MNKPPALNRIHILDRHTANQIAAGEVVERPFSVVKELVENAIDAGATMISVAIADAGLEKIQVSDNGCGMSAEEMRLAVLRHATSKINNISDLDSLSTLGFRGEALPSIAAVSYLTIISKQTGEQHGYSMTVRAGQAIMPTEAAAKTGTTVTVERLFHNTPARRKFMKSPRTELGLISDLIAKYIVAYPGISFRLQNGAHTIYHSAGQGNPEHALFEAFGRQVAEQMLPFVRGFISLPTLSRPNRQSYHFFINGRPARSRELARAVDDAYAGFLPQRRYPIIFIELELPPDSIDVNVHPGKLEVKFRDFAPLRQELIAEIQATLAASLGRAPSLLPERQDDRPVTQDAGSYEQQPEQGSAAILREPSAELGHEIYQVLYAAANSHSLNHLTSAANQGGGLPGEQRPLLTQPQFFGGTDTDDSSERLRFASLTPLGQFAGSFLICSSGEQLYIIDQHAAAERVLYEKIAARAAREPSHSAQLAVPVAVELSILESAQLTESILELREAGFIIEHFGDNSFVIRGLPLWYEGDDAEQLLRLFLEETEGGTLNTLRLRREKLFSAACRQAIKANRYLTPTDISALLLELDQCDNPLTCPHGRPLMLRISRAEIYKRFLRGSI
ncbi:MAG: DNA mismatch repair endonuclease MutL [Clostridia bacterium]|nr:DNA mismatch repair endonuclease MutL [Clostridia bacterium]